VYDIAAAVIAVRVILVREAACFVMLQCCMEGHVLLRKVKRALFPMLGVIICIFMSISICNSRRDFKDYK
jgi:hypothetical protein